MTDKGGGGEKQKLYSRELVLAISFTSLGSNHTFFLPHRITEAASLLCNLRELHQGREKHKLLGYVFQHKIFIAVGQSHTAASLVLSVQTDSVTCGIVIGQVGRARKSVMSAFGKNRHMAVQSKFSITISTVIIHCGRSIPTFTGVHH